MTGKAPPNIVEAAKQAMEEMGPFQLPKQPPLTAMSYPEQIAMARKRLAGPQLYDALSVLVAAVHARWPGSDLSKSRFSDPMKQAIAANKLADGAP